MFTKANLVLHQQYAEKFRLGEEPGLKYFFDECYEALCLYALRLCGEDGFPPEIASEAFYQTWRQRHQFHSADSIKAYLYTVVKNGCLKHLQQKNRENSIRYELLNQPEKTVHDAIVFSETMRQLYGCINELPPQCKAVMQYLYVQGRSVAETAQEMQLTISTVKAHKRNGIEMLRRRINPVHLVSMLEALKR